MIETGKQEDMKFQQEIVLLRQENIRLLREVNDMKRDYANLEHQLSKASYTIWVLRGRLNSSISFGQVITAIGVLVMVILLFYYGTGFVELSAPSVIENYTSLR